MTTKFEIKDNIGISQGVTITVESEYLLISNRKKCKDLLSKNLSNEEKIDFLISLHLVLEIGINTLFRQFFKNHGFGWFSNASKIEHLDKISFINKITSIIYFSKFKFDSEEMQQANEHVKVLENLKTFTEARNKFLHGYEISKTTILNGKISSSSTSKASKLVFKYKDQIELFKSIINAVAFFMRHIDCSITAEGKENLINEYLDIRFLESDNSLVDNQS